MKPHLWKLALLAGLVWLAVLVQHNLSQPAAPDNAGELEQATSEATDIPSSATPLPIPATPTQAAQLLPTPTATPPPVWHTIQSGEVLLAIAADYGLTLEALLAANPGTDPARLQIGQQLLIPVTPTPLLSTRLPSPTAAPSPVIYTVQQGDTLLAIAAEHDLTAEALIIANKLADPRRLQVGQQLLIPPDQGPSSGQATIIHEIESGDTLLGLANRYGSTLADILAANPELDPNSLRVGQQIIIPVDQVRANPASNPGQSRIVEPDLPPPPLVSLEQEMIEAVNQQRQAQGLPPYIRDEALTTVARAHAQDMVSRGYFGHVTLEGLSLRDRLAAQDLTLNWVGENIIRTVKPISQTVDYSIDWFMNDPPHRQNILHDHFDRVGIGVAEGPPGWYTFVQVFAGDS